MTCAQNRYFCPSNPFNSAILDLWRNPARALARGTFIIQIHKLHRGRGRRCFVEKKSSSSHSALECLPLNIHPNTQIIRPCLHGAQLWDGESLPSRVSDMPFFFIFNLKRGHRCCIAKLESFSCISECEILGWKVHVQANALIKCFH